MAERKKQQFVAPKGGGITMPTTSPVTLPPMAAPAPPPPANGFPMSTQGNAEAGYLYHSGNLLDPNRVMVDPGVDDPMPVDYKSIYNEMLAAMTPPKPMMNFDASPYQQAMGTVNQQAGIGQAAIGQSQQELMQQLQQLQANYAQTGQRDINALQAGQQGVTQSIGNAMAPINADLAAQGVSAQVGGGARAAALQAQQGAQMNRANVMHQGTLGSMQDRSATGTAMGQSANRLLGSNLQGALGEIQHDQLKAQTQAQNDYIRALNSWQAGRAGDAKSVLGMIADAMPDKAGLTEKWAGESGPTADKVAETFAMLGAGTSPSEILGNLGKKVWVPVIGPDGEQETDAYGEAKQKQISVEQQMREQGIDVTQYKKAVREFGEPPKQSKKQQAMQAIYR